MTQLKLILMAILAIFGRVFSAFASAMQDRGDKSALKVLRPLCVVGLLAAITACGGKPPQEIPFTGDACQYAKHALVQTSKEYREIIHRKSAAHALSLGFIGTGEFEKKRELEEARNNVATLCHESPKEDDETWACAEGHSCR